MSKLCTTCGHLLEGHGRVGDYGDCAEFGYYGNDDESHILVDGVPIIVIKGTTGLFYGTSEKVKGLLVTCQSREAVPEAVRKALSEFDSIKKIDPKIVDLFSDVLGMFGLVMVLYKAQTEELTELKQRVRLLEEMANASVPKVKVDNIPNRVEPESAAEASNREAKLLAPGNQPVLHRGGTLKTNIQSLYGSDVPECPPSRDDTKPNPNTND